MDTHDDVHNRTDSDVSNKRARDMAATLVITIGLVVLSVFAFLLLYTFVCSVVLERDKYICKLLSPNELYSILIPGTRINAVYNDIKSMWIDNTINTKGACIMLAPYASHDVQLAIAKYDTSYEIIANPTFTVCDQSKTHVVKEESPLCDIRMIPGTSNRFLVQRYNCIHVSYMSIDNTQEEKTLYDIDAYCYQHMYDVFNGKIPCDTITKSSMGRTEL